MGDIQNDKESKDKNFKSLVDLRPGMKGVNCTFIVLEKGLNYFNVHISLRGLFFNKLIPIFLIIIRRWCNEDKRRSHNNSLSGC